MIDYIQLFLGMLGLTLMSSYLGWCKFRIFCVRQDLFEIRDDLWCKARELNGFDDPAYRQARSSINAMIRTAHKVNLPVLLYLMKEFPHEPESQKSESAELQSAIDGAVRRTAAVLVRYVIFYRPFSALVEIVKFMVTHRTRRIVNSVRDKIACWLDRGGPRHLEGIAGV